MLDFSTTVQQRQSIRAYDPTPLSRAELEAVLRDALRAPSAVNAQPWQVHIASGETLKKLSAALLEKFAGTPPRPDFPYEQAAFTGVYEARMRECYKNVQDSVGLSREDREGRRQLAAENMRFYGAPHAAFFFAPTITDNVFVALDVVLLVQNFMLALTARGFGSVPQLVLAFYPDVVREIFNVPADMKLLLGVSFGRPDESAPINRLRQPRAPLSETAFFHD